MTTRQPTEPGWDANGSPVDEEQAEWEAAERRLRLMLAKPVPWLVAPYECEKL